MTATAVLEEHLPIDRIVVARNDREHFADGELEELAESIRTVGLAEPIGVRPLGDGRYELMCGERRLRAHRLLGRRTIRALVEDVDDLTAAARMLAENVHRVDLNPMEEARAYQQRQQQFGLTAAEVAEHFGVRPARVRDRLALLELCDDARDLIERGQLGAGNAALMVGLDGNRQRLALQALARENLDWWALKELCGRLRAEQDQEAMFDPDDFLRIEEYARDARARGLGVKGLRALVRELGEALAAAGGDPALVSAARAAAGE